ncbi:MAG: hypothetical protein FJ265_01035 [Planctomycetes bacterium]|nr:hypothetical protein [Planctomycetota bacterium]
MPTLLHALIVDPDAASAQPLMAALASTGRTATAVPSAAAMRAAVERQEPESVWVAESLPAAEWSKVQLLAGRCGAPLVLAVAAAVPAPAHLERALQCGCATVLGAGAPAERIEAAFAQVLARRQHAVREREELRRLKFQADDLRRRSLQQAEAFHRAQETFFLDLSRMMTIITNIMDGIVFVDRGGNVTLLNPVAEDLLDTKSFVAIGKPLGALQGRAELLGALVADHGRLETQKEVVQTVEIHHSEQDLLYIKCITSRVVDYRGQPAGTLSVLKDVTAEFKTDQLKNQYLSIVAHELRTPLTGIKTFATMMAKGSLGPLGDRQQRVCESIREQSLRLEHQIDKLVNLGNLESADYGRDLEVVLLDDFLAGLLLPFEQPARDRRIELTLVAEPGDHCLYADRIDLRRACQALIENAVKFTADGGHVQVRVAATPDGGLVFGVCDDGIGIDPRYHRRIFEKFFQVEDPLTRHHGGAGLGLFVARGIVEAHGSRIEVLSQLGRGADFSFALPVHPRVGAPSTAAARA